MLNHHRCISLNALFHVCGTIKTVLLSIAHGDEFFDLTGGYLLPSIYQDRIVEFGVLGQ